MKDLFSFEDPKKMIVLNKKEGPVLLTFEEVVERCQNFINVKVASNIGMTKENTLIDIGDLKSVVIFAMYKAYQSYEWNYEGQVVNFLYYCETKVKGEIKLLFQNSKAKKRAVYTESDCFEEEDGEELIAMPFHEDNHEKVDLFEYLEHNFSPNDTALFKEMCVECMTYGKLDKVNFAAEHNIHRNTANNKWRQLKDIIKGEYTAYEERLS